MILCPVIFALKEEPHTAPSKKRAELNVVLNQGQVPSSLFHISHEDRKEAIGENAAQSYLHKSYYNSKSSGQCAYLTNKSLFLLPITDGHTLETRSHQR